MPSLSGFVFLSSKRFWPPTLNVTLKYWPSLTQRFVEFLEVFSLDMSLVFYVIKCCFRFIMLLFYFRVINKSYFSSLSRYFFSLFG